jgi:hypothetical protein
MGNSCTFYNAYICNTLAPFLQLQGRLAQHHALFPEQGKHQVANIPEVEVTKIFLTEV